MPMIDYLGYITIPYDEHIYPVLQSGKLPDNINMLINQYLVVYDAETETVVENFRWDGTKLERIPFKQINSHFCGKIKSRNVQQTLAIDMLYREDITVKVLTGKFGTGKDMLMCSAAIDLLEKDKYGKIIWVRNNIEVKNSNPIGHLPGDYKDKLLPFAMPLADHLGGVEGLQMMIAKGDIEIVHLGFIRGRDIKKSIIMCSEAENMTKEHIQLLIGRVGEGSSLWINGDYRQVDKEVFQTNSGMSTMINKLKGHPRFGYVQLLKTERSETAAMADLLD